MRLFFTLISLAIFSIGQSQTISRQVISSTGNQTSNGSYTVGQIEFSTISSNGITLTQGFQQPEDIEEEEIINEANFDLVFPECFLSSSIIEIQLVDFICDGEIPEVSLNGAILSEPYSIPIDQTANIELVYPNEQCNVTLEVNTSAPPGLEPCGFKIPTLITPNNDMVNDQWQLVNASSEPNSQVSIYSKWGEEVYRYNGEDIQQASWDGSDLSGDALPAGVYFYLLELGDQQFKGTINLMR
ncbi:MAG: gliding motility-associated C-terminal domain-containing protein [Flavobacteriales bacterium]|nr:gliding motility-associated C-terminal domain-containing protein [Flavobacteriales bacterium]